LLDWLAADFTEHHYDIRFLIKRILTSRAYQLPAVNLGEQTQHEFAFRGPSVRRLSAEQFRDALTSLTGIGYSVPATDVNASPTELKQFALPIAPVWIWNDPQAADKTRAGHVYFRKAVNLISVPGDAMAVVICDNSFTLFVNGHQLGSGNEFKNAYLFDLKPWLRKGTNVFAVDAVNHLADNSIPEGNPPAGSENPAGLLFYARLRQMDKAISQTNDFVSDNSWICSDSKKESWELPEFMPVDWNPAVKLGEIGMLPWRENKEHISGKLAAFYPGKVRAALVAADPLMTALGRPNREQIVTTRPSAATTLEALELTNGETLDDILKRGAKNVLERQEQSVAKRKLVKTIFLEALGREPGGEELKNAMEVLGEPVQSTGVEDLLWAITMSPEFQLIY
jgi:hypothetical protein